jgi:hypothetical protein
VVETLEPDIEAQRDALADRLFSSANATFDLAGVYLGDRLGLFRALADGGPATSAELAGRTALDERYVREWLEQEAVSGILEADGSGDAAARRYTLPAGHREVLVDELSLAHMTPFVRAIVGSIRMLPGIMAAFTDGGGVAWADYGDDLREGQAAGNRPQFQHLMADWLGQIPDVHARLSAPGARVADVACGEGWSTIASRVPIRTRASPASTSTSRPSNRRDATPPRPRSPIASHSMHETPRIRRSRARSTWSPSSRPCTTCHNRSRCSGLLAGCWLRAER